MTYQAYRFYIAVIYVIHCLTCLILIQHFNEYYSTYVPCDLIPQTSVELHHRRIDRSTSLALKRASPSDHTILKLKQNGWCQFYDVVICSFPKKIQYLSILASGNIPFMWKIQLQIWWNVYDQIPCVPGPCFAVGLLTSLEIIGSAYMLSFLESRDLHMSSRQIRFVGRVENWGNLHQGMQMLHV